MASIKKLPSGSFQLSVKNRLLPKTLWATFDSYEQAEAYGKQLEGLLAQGIVPASLLDRPAPRREIWTIPRCIAEYVRNNDVPLSDVRLLDTLTPTVLTLSTSNLNYAWAEGWVRMMKRDLNLAPLEEGVVLAVLFDMADTQWEAALFQNCFIDDLKSTKPSSRSRQHSNLDLPPAPPFTELCSAGPSAAQSSRRRGSSRSHDEAAAAR